MKTTICREKRLTYSKDDKDGKDPRVCGAGRKGLSHIMQDWEKRVVDWEGEMAKLFKWIIPFC